MSYGNDSISMLKGPDRVRLRPGVIFGSDGLDGCEHAFFEILSNSIDEAREGHGDLISVTLHKDHSITVQDFGRGCPVEWNEPEQKFNWELVFCELYAGGKYNNMNGENYEFSLGLNGLGTCATQYASKWMNVSIVRDGYQYNLKFEKGFNAVAKEPGYQKKKSTAHTGTTIHWLPDDEVFTDTKIPTEYFLEVLNKQAIINAGLRMRFYDETSEQTQEFYYAGGVLEYMKQQIHGKQATAIQVVEQDQVGRDKPDGKDYKVRMYMAFCFCTEVAHTEYYHNSSWLEYGGAPEKAVRAAFVSVLDAYMKKNGKYHKSEAKITVQDVLDSLFFVSNCFSTQASYENQTKKAVKNKFIEKAMTDALKQYLTDYFIKNPNEAAQIAKQILVNKRSREQAERSKINIRKKLSGSINVLSHIDKFVDCRSKDPKERELYIVEGDSALGSCKQGRDASFQAIMPVRGKVLNCLKADYDKIFKSEIIVDLLRIFGCGVEISSKKNNSLNQFQLKNLRYHKIIICTDADVDGYQIRTLILSMIYRLVPTLIREGYVYIAESPLYEIHYKEEVFFAFDEAEKTAILKKLRGKKVSIQRSKGLGENEPEMMWKTTMDPTSRRLIQVSIQDAEAADQMFHLLLGDKLQDRKDYIAEHGEKYLEQIEAV